MAKHIQQFGTWSSPISSKMLAEGTRLTEVMWDTTSESLVWLESSGGQTSLKVQQGIDAPRVLNDGEMTIRGRVGYGGGNFTVHDGVVYFAGKGGRLYKVPLSGGAARALTPAFGSIAAPAVSADGKWVLYTHTQSNVDGLGLVDSNGEMWPRKFAFGTDFVMQPTWHSQGHYVAYIVWDHPAMPWDVTELRLGHIAYDHAGVPYLVDYESIAGGVSIFQPEFSPDGHYLSYISDETGFGQLYVYDLIQKTHVRLTDADAEHGTPAWIQGMRTYGWLPDSRGFYFLRNTKGFFSLHHYLLESATESPVIGLERYSSMEQISISSNGTAALIVSSSTQQPRIIDYHGRIYSRAGLENISPLAEAQPVEWIGDDGEPVYGLYYPPTSNHFEGVGAPPLIVSIHGGPTSQKTAGYEDEAQFFATRGFAVLYVNHRGSTGYGTAYKDKLRRNWGVVDVEDAASGANYLVQQGLADASCLMIMGGSAGGYTVLQSLVDKPGFYKAGICRYGISNQFMLVQDTHKFEAHYNDSIMGTLPEDAEIYRARSPLFHAEKIVDPVIIFQGAEDNVVPRNQSDSLVASLQKRGVPHEYHVYEGEGHGFRQPKHIQHYYDAIVHFVMQYVIYA